MPSMHSRRNLRGEVDVKRCKGTTDDKQERRNVGYTQEEDFEDRIGLAGGGRGN